MHKSLPLVTKLRFLQQLIRQDFSLHTEPGQQHAPYRRISSEGYDDSNYFSELRGDEIPIKVRISAAADVLGALTPSLKDAMADTRSDRDCIEALSRNINKVVEIKQRCCDEALP